jgi:hypothetical protein
VSLNGENFGMGLEDFGFIVIASDSEDVVFAELLEWSEDKLVFHDQ